MMQLIEKLGMLLPVVTDEKSENSNLFIYNHEIIWGSQFENLLGLTREKKKVDSMIEQLKSRGREYAHLLEFAAKTSLILR